MTSEKRRKFLLPVVVAAIVFLGLLPSRVQIWLPDSWLGNAYVDELLKTQVLGLAAPLLVVLSALLAGRLTAQRYLTLGDRDADIEPMPRIGLTLDLSYDWKKMGTALSQILTSFTAIVAYFGIIRGNVIALHNVGLVPWIFVFAALTALTQELVIRYGLVTSLVGLVPDSWIHWTSAGVSAILAVFLTKAGLAGFLLGGIYGYFMAKAVLETRGLYWAWFLRFWQQVILYGALFAIYL